MREHDSAIATSGNGIAWSATFDGLDRIFLGTIEIPPGRRACIHRSAIDILAYDTVKCEYRYMSRNVVCQRGIETTVTVRKCLAIGMATIDERFSYKWPSRLIPDRSVSPSPFPPIMSF
jgi:hypothetical protein